MKKNVTIVLAGINGYGGLYLNALLDDPRNTKIAGLVDPYWDKCARLSEIKDKNIPLYKDLESFYKEHSADLAVLSSPIHMHCPQSITALSNGSHVLCEKPLAATIQEARQLIKAEKKYKKTVHIGYQWSFSNAIQALKKDVLNGVFGKPLLLKTLVLWPRGATYYGRNNWAGAMKTADGQWILDSPVNNATAHYLHNMLYILGKDIFSSISPLKVEAELYRANKISNFDTAAMRVNTAGGMQILFYSTHAIPLTVGPLCNYKFEKASVLFSGSDMYAKFNDGTIKFYGNPNDNTLNKLWFAVENIKNGKNESLCGPEAASAQTLCINGAQSSMPEIVTVPESEIETVETSKDTFTCIKNLTSYMIQCFDMEILPSELGCVKWSKKGNSINLKDYKEFSL